MTKDEGTTPSHYNSQKALILSFDYNPTTESISLRLQGLSGAEFEVLAKSDV